jgi:hypothetical protein
MLLALPFACLLLGPADGADSRSSDLAGYDRLIKPEDRQHWAFQPVRPPSVPRPKNSAWVRNPIDAFVLAKLEARGWRPSPSAGPRALLRRLYLDLIGLPSTPGEQEAFLNDSSPRAMDHVVDDLLSRPGYGERWARHWLDLVRYADSNGYERDAAKPSVWRYRDYVINALNQDKPYDRFVLEQLAGDELPDASPETVIATGYYRLGPWDDEPADPKEDRFDQLDDMVNTTSLVFMGLTLGCARCHNHKFEPITQHDYYRMVAILDALQRPQKGRMELDLPAMPPGEMATGGRASDSLGNATRGYFLHEPSANPPATHLLIRGKASRPGPEVQPGLPAVLVARQPSFPSPGPHTSLRRLTLARWIASADNPLTARVLVNRVWQLHFGEGLVRTPSDFGLKGDAPTHPELLDWLAAWFVKEGWSLKKLHRLILSSNTYRMSKQWNAEYGAKDPQNRLLWRVPYRRLEVEAIRDSMLAVSGQLNPRMFGPSMYPQVSAEVLAANSDPDKIWKASDEREASRRTVYAFVKRSMVVPLLEVLDLCDSARSSPQRVVTTVAPQALALFNGEFVNRQADHLAHRLVTEAGPEPKKQIDRAYLLALCRPPSPTERDALAQFLGQEESKLIREAADAGRALDPREAQRIALQQMCRVIFNLNEFAYTD